MKIKKNHLYAGVGVVVLVLIAGAFYLKSPPTSKKIDEAAGKNSKIQWMIDKNGYLYYPLKREQIKFQRTTINETDGLLISKIIYPSTGTDIYGILVLPKNI